MSKSKGVMRMRPLIGRRRCEVGGWSGAEVQPHGHDAIRCQASDDVVMDCDRVFQDRAGAGFPVLGP